MRHYSRKTFHIFKRLKMIFLVVRCDTIFHQSNIKPSISGVADCRLNTLICESACYHQLGYSWNENHQSDVSKISQSLFTNLFCKNNGISNICNVFVLLSKKYRLFLKKKHSSVGNKWHWPCIGKIYYVNTKIGNSQTSIQWFES